MSNKIDPDANKMTPLMVAASKGDIQSVNELIASGVDVNETDIRGGTALMYAAMNKFLDVVNALLDAGADPTVQTHKGFSAIDFAHQSESFVVISRLERAVLSALKKQPVNPPIRDANFCSNCGTSISSEAQFCSKCGNPVLNQSTMKAGDSKKKQMLGLIGSSVLFIGVFAPIVRVPIIGSMNYFQNGNGDGVLVLILAIVSFVLVLMKKYQGLWYTGLGSLGILLFSFINFQMKLSNMKAEMESTLTDNPFRGFADVAMQSVQLDWGWALLILGSVLVVASAASKESSNS